MGPQNMTFRENVEFYSAVAAAYVSVWRTNARARYDRFVRNVAHRFDPTYNKVMGGIANAYNNWCKRRYVAKTDKLIAKTAKVA